MVDAASRVFADRLILVDREDVERALSAALAIPVGDERPALTPRQRTAFEFIAAYIEATGSAPTIVEVRAALGNKSKGSTHRIVSAIVDRGYLKRLPRQARALALV
tara:strand:+ start:2362 stop:2679 length:318 start_codon:yes stop_codon:yes gene_type:complete